MMCQVDELESTRIFEMQELEFMEALARIADKLYGGEENDDNLGVRLERLL